LEIPDSTGPHFTRKWHLMRAFEKAEADGSYPAFLSIWLHRDELTSDTGFLLYSKEAANRVRKAMRGAEKGKIEIPEDQVRWLVENVLGPMPWRKSLQIGNSVACAPPVKWDSVVYAAVITDRDWLRRYCIQGQYAQDWEKRHVCRGKVSVDDVDRAVRFRGGLKAFPFICWQGRRIDEIAVESKGTFMRLEDLDGKRVTEQPGYNYDDVLRFHVAAGFADSEEVDDGVGEDVDAGVEAPDNG